MLSNINFRRHVDVTQNDSSGNNNCDIEHTLWCETCKDGIDLCLTDGVLAYKGQITNEDKPDRVDTYRENQWYTDILCAIQIPNYDSYYYDLNEIEDKDADLIEILISKRLSTKVNILLCKCQLRKIANEKGPNVIYSFITKEIQRLKHTNQSMENKTMTMSKQIVKLENDLMKVTSVKDAIQSKMCQTACVLLNSKKQEIRRLNEIIETLCQRSKIKIEGLADLTTTGKLSIADGENLGVCTEPSRIANCAISSIDETKKKRKTSCQNFIASSKATKLRKKRNKGELDTSDEDEEGSASSGDRGSVSIASRTSRRKLESKPRKSNLMLSDSDFEYDSENSDVNSDPMKQCKGSFHDSSTVDSMDNTNSSSARETCPQCGIIFHDASFLQIHVESEHGDQGTCAIRNYIGDSTEFRSKNSQITDKHASTTAMTAPTTSVMSKSYLNRLIDDDFASQYM